MANTTTIEISTENWQWLNAQKEPGESFNDVLDRLRPDNMTPTVVEPARSDEPLPDELDLPGSGTTLEARRVTLSRLYAYLQQEGSAAKSDMLELVDPEYVGYSSAESFWSNAIKGRDSLRVLPGIRPPNEGEHSWHYEA